MQIHKRSIHIIALVVMLCSGNIFAQDSLGLKQAINIAFSRNSQVTTLQNTYQNQLYSIDNAKGSLFPTLSLSGGYTRNISSTKGGVIIDQNGIPRTVDASTNGN
ncbi:MAG: TolC family protein, partial [Ignavibacteria bacterium]|nr:TolC family protein [Ignavibacteria bacterium]